MPINAARFFLKAQVRAVAFDLGLIGVPLGMLALLRFLDPAVAIIAVVCSVAGSVVSSNVTFRELVKVVE